MTEPKDYETAPVGDRDKTMPQGFALEFTNFTLSQPSSTQAKKAKANNAFNRLTDQTWSQVANILNMFGRVEEGKAPANLSIWAEGFKDGELTGEMLRSGKIWSDQQPNGSSDKLNQPLGQDGSGTKYLKHNNLTWKYTNSSDSITLTVEGQNNPNAYRAGYTGNQYASYQVGFAEKDGKIDASKTVEVKLTLVSQTIKKAR